MKKIVLILLLLSCSMYESLAQDYYSDFYERVYPTVLESCVQSPVIHTLFSYKEYPVLYSTGQVDIQIPLYELKINSLSLPLKLSYNSSGIKIQDNPGIIGYGWSINNSFKISRVIRGKDDLEFPVNQIDVSIFSSMPINSSSFVDLLDRIAPEDRHNRPYLYDSKKIDGQYDIFKIELPNINIAFVLECVDGVYTSCTFNPSPLSIKLLTSNKMKTNGDFVSRYTDLYGIEVIDNEGVRYLFGESESQDSRMQNKYTEYNGNTTGSSPSKTAWMLRQIIIPSGRVINLSYKDAIDYSDFRPKVKTSIHYNNFLIKNTQAGSQNDLLLLRGDPGAAIRDGNHIQYNINLIAIREKNEGIEEYQTNPEGTYFKLIRSIKGVGVELEFIYDSIPKLGAPDVIPLLAGAAANKLPYNRQFLSGLKVYSQLNGSRHEEVNEINFYSHEGFLDSLDRSGNGKYKFLYDRRDKNFTAEQFQKAIDWWGYCNGKDNVSSLPINDSNGDAASKRNPDSLFTKVRTLERITYPTGGCVKINYGTHHFLDGSYGAGLRVESLETFEPTSGKVITKRFKYENPQYSGIPYELDKYQVTFRTHLYAGKDIMERLGGRYVIHSHALAYEVDIDAWSRFTFPIVNTPYTSYHVWYKNVTEESEEGKIEYEYEYTPFERDPGFWGRIINNTMFQEEPALIEQRVYAKNEGGNFDLVKSIKNLYKRNVSFLYEVSVLNKYSERSTYDGIYKRGTYRDLPEINYSHYPQRLLNSLILGSFHLDSSVETAYFSNDSTATRVRYFYDEERPYNLIAKNTYLDNYDMINQRYYYSNHAIPVYKGILETDHGLVDCESHKSTVILQETRQNNLFIASNMTYFKIVNTSQIVPKEKYYSGPDGVMEKREEYRSYDYNGNPVEIVKDKYSSMVRFWGYGGRYPVAEIRNATNSQINNVLRTWAFLLSLYDTIPDQLWSNLNNIRSTSGFESTMITTYRYKPLVGLIEMVDPRGISTHYDYDEHGRLKEVYIIENGNKKLLQEHEYRYYNDENE